MKKLILALALLAVSALACANTEQCYYHYNYKPKDGQGGHSAYVFEDETSWLDSLLGYPCGELTAMSSLRGFSDGGIKDIELYGIDCADKTMIVISDDEVEVGYMNDLKEFTISSTKKTTKAFKTCRRAVAKFMKRIKNNSVWDG